MDIVTIDMETYYDRDYSLSKMTTEAYVRDPRFEVIGVGVKVNDHPVDWYTGANPGKFLNSLDYSDKAILAHNTVFDGAILSWHFGIKPKLWLDTLSMARPLHNVAVGGSLKNLVAYYRLGEKGDEVIHALGKRRSDFTPEEMARYASYCCNDVDLTYKLFKKLSRGFPVSELMIIDQTLRMYTEPSLVLDRALLIEHLESEVNRKEDLVTSLGMDCSEDVAKAVLMSNDKLADYLTVLGIEPPTKISPTTKKRTWAFSKSDKNFTSLMEHENPYVANAVAARLGVKSTIEESRTRSLIGVSDRGALPILLNYYGAHTGRFSGGDKMNLQNLPRGGALRKSICAPPGMMLVACDSSQIEARVLAWVAGQHDLVQAFAEGRDIYSEFASLVYGRTVSKADKLERFVGKTSILGLGYGMGSTKFRDTLALGMGGLKVEIDADEAQRIVGTYRDRNTRIAALWNRCNTALSNIVQGGEFPISQNLSSLVTSAEGIRLPNGLFIRYPLLTQTSDGYAYAGDARVFRAAVRARALGEPLPTDKFTRIYGGKAVENCLAGDTQVLTRRGWVSITDVTPHDQLWDGVEWVKHDGLIFQGYKSTIMVDGVRMTPDHKILTNEGWRRASSCEGLYRSNFRLPDSTQLCGDRWAPFGVEVSLPVRAGGRARRDRCREVRPSRRYAFMRLRAWRQKQNPWYVETPSLSCVALHGGQVQVTLTPSVGQLRRARDLCVPTVGGFVPGFLGRYGAYIQAGANPRSQEQQRGLYLGELSLDDAPRTGTEPPQLTTRGHRSGLQVNRHPKVYPTLPVEAEAVYDIRNAGPRSRFVVRGNAGPFIVHNCVQALARIVVAEQMAIIGSRYKVVLQVHDEVVVLCDEAEVKDAEAYMVQVMSTPPSWAPDLPVACEADYGENYGSCK